ncbi:hypothetical protein [Actinorhabdospora filicis]|uniref:hypothetical protein n=1 Tax=Actinorhabdospora filicis TaxID=1785913 RepID=UPI0025548E92|nr:hypothetical protein [Actinorhabdospora filicis]
MTLQARATHTHLFRGAELRLPGLPALTPTTLTILFADGVITAAELTESPETETWLLHVHGHTTEAGAVLEPSMWWLKDSASEGDDLTVKIGGRLP